MPDSNEDGRNAREAMPGRNGGTLTVVTRTSAQILNLSIGDDGPGIDQRHLEGISEPFFTTRTAGAASGLGLSLCRVILARRLEFRRTSGRPAVAEPFCVDDLSDAPRNLAPRRKSP